VEVEVRHQLPALLAAVYHQAVAAFGGAFLPGQFIGNADQASHQGNISFTRLNEGSYVLPGNDQQMHRRLGVNITEGYYLIISINYVTGELAGYNLTENATHFASSFTLTNVPPVPGRALLKQVAALGIAGDDGREVLYLKAHNGLGCQVRVGDNIRLPDGPRKQSAGTTYGHKIDRLVLFDSLSYFARAAALAYHGLKSGGDKGRRIAIHPAAGGRPGRADNLPRTGRGRPHIIKGLAFNFEGQLSPPVERLHQPPVRRIAGGI
jgi:hypothetical protein